MQKVHGLDDIRPSRTQPGLRRFEGRVGTAATHGHPVGNRPKRAVPILAVVDLAAECVLDGVSL